MLSGGDWGELIRLICWKFKQILKRISREFCRGPFRTPHPAIKSSKLTIKTQEQGVKYVQS